MRIVKRITLLLILCILNVHTFSQTLTLSTNQISFGNVFENSPDSMQLIISNNVGYSINVTGIKFYNIYGNPAFSASSSFFTLADGSSNTIWIKFSPKHNVFHNSEMVIDNDGLRGAISVDLRGQGKYSNHYYDLTQNLSEENLKNAITQITTAGSISLGYNNARDEMFMSIDNKKVNGQGAAQNTLECVYTGRLAVGYTDRSDCQTNFSFNTEHTLPQSLFASAEPMKSDLHHLFPTDDAANSERADNPFGYVTNPTWNNGGSSSDGSIFEPRDLHKGEVARALFYFVLRFQNYNNFLNSQETTLRTWHNAFPPDAISLKRNDDIFSIQHNRNPFIDYPVFTDRITTISTTSVAPVINSVDLIHDTIIYGTIPVSSPVIYSYVIVNNGNTDLSLTNFNLTHSSELTFASTGADTIIAPGDALTLMIRCITSTTDSIRAFLSFNTNATGNANVSVPIFVNDLLYNSISENIETVNIYPNPAHDMVHINLNNQFGWEMHDMTGRLIKRSLFNEKNSSINLDEVVPGVYFLKIFEKTLTLSRKIIVN